MATNKTIETEASVDDYIAAIAEEKKRHDFSFLMNLISKHVKLKPKMWGNAIVGFGSYHYVYDSGREGDAPLVAISSRANSITFYLGSFDGKETLLAKFGKYKSGKGCYHIKKLEDIDTAVLLDMVKKSKEQSEKEAWW